MESGICVGKRRPAVALRALSGATKHQLPARGGRGIEATGRGRWCRETQLVRLQRRQLRADGIGRRVVHIHPGTRLVERAVAMHLRDADVSVPVRHILTVAGSGDLVNALEAIRGRDHLRSVLSIKVVARIVLPCSPRVVDRLLSWRECGRERDDRAGIEVAIRPSVEPLTDPRSERVVRGGVTERAGNSDSHQRIVVSRAHDGSLQPYDGVELEERDRRRRAREADRAALNPLHHLGRQRVGIDLETDGERRRWVDRVHDDQIHVQRVRPERFVAVRVEAEDVLPLCDQCGIRWRIRGSVVAATRAAQRDQHRGERGHEREVLRRRSCHSAMRAGDGFDLGEHHEPPS